jgi:hypothetical protein
MKDFAFSTTTDAPELVPAVAWSDESPLISSYLSVWWGKRNDLLPVIGKVTVTTSETITGLGPHNFRSRATK